MPGAHHLHVLLAFDFTPAADVALERAVDVAARAPQHVLHVVSVIAPGRPLLLGELDAISHESPVERIHQMITARMAIAFASRSTTEENQFFVHVRVGRPSREILAVAREVGADLIFIGSHDHGRLGRLFTGSVPEQVVRSAHCPVMVVRPKTYSDLDMPEIVSYQQARLAYAPPARYSYVNGLIVRPKDWPI
jgi:nucleotide-binding universal stress UspA family protein